MKAVGETQRLVQVVVDSSKHVNANQNDGHVYRDNCNSHNFDRCCRVFYSTVVAITILSAVVVLGSIYVRTVAAHDAVAEHEAVADRDKNQQISDIASQILSVSGPICLGLIVASCCTKAYLELKDR